MLYVATERTSWIVFGLLLFAAGAVVALPALRRTSRTRVDALARPVRPTTYERSAPARPGPVRHGRPAASLGTGLGQGHPELIAVRRERLHPRQLGEELGLAGIDGASCCSTASSSSAACAPRSPPATPSASCSPSACPFAFGAPGLRRRRRRHRLIPLTGMTMPFLALRRFLGDRQLGLVAILLRISDNARRPARAARPVASDDRRRRDPGGAMPVNTPLRRIAIFVAAAVLGPARRGNRISVRRRPTTLSTDGRQPPHRCSTSTPASAAPSSSTAQPIASPCRSTTSTSFMRTYPQGGLYAPVTGFDSQVFGATGSSASRTRSSPATTTALLQTGHATCSPAAAAGRQRRH